MQLPQRKFKGRSWSQGRVILGIGTGFLAAGFVIPEKAQNAERTGKRESRHPEQCRQQHKAGIRAAGSVLKRGLEVLIGPVLHLQGIPRAQAEEVEEGLAEALRAEGLIVQGGH